MSTEVSFVVYYGLKLTGEEAETFYDAYDLRYGGEESQEYDVLYDGISGEYCLLGVQVAYMHQYGNEPDTVLELKHIESRRQTMLTALRRDYPELKHMFEKPWDLIALCHWH